MNTYDVREELVTSFPLLDEWRLELAGVSTPVLEGGDGLPMVLLHGPGESAVGWLPVLPDLVRSHRVIAPDLPGHGASQIVDGELDADRVLRWLGELIERTCPTPPVLVGRVIGGTIGARSPSSTPPDSPSWCSWTRSAWPRSSRRRGSRSRCTASSRTRPNTVRRFMEFCAFDLDGVRERLGVRWEPFAEYAVELARTPSVQAAMRGLIGQFAAAPIPPEQLARIDVPTTLIWGRDDLATAIADRPGGRRTPRLAAARDRRRR